VTRALHRNDALAALFLETLLLQNIRIEADLVDHLLNSSEKEARSGPTPAGACWRAAAPVTVTLKISQETLAEMIGTTRSRVQCVH